VSLDPPRAGLGAEAAEKLAELGAPEIAYLSCDPSTLARDLAVLTGSSKKGTVASADNAIASRYEISEVHLFDLFPQTFHIETLVRLRRAREGAGHRNRHSVSCGIALGLWAPVGST